MHASTVCRATSSAWRRRLPSIGPRFDLALLRAVTSDPSRVEHGLDYLCQAEIVEEHPAAASTEAISYRFTATPPARCHLRQPLAAAPQAVARPHRARPSSGCIMAYRLGLRTSRNSAVITAGPTKRGRAPQYLMAAGDLARKTYANDDAMRLYREALAAISDKSTGQFGIACSL